MGAVEERQHAVVKCILPRDVALECHRAVNGAPRRKEQVVVFAEIYDRADVEGGAGVGEVGLIERLMIDLDADKDIGENLLLEHGPYEPPIVVAGKGIEAVAASAIGCP